MENLMMGIILEDIFSDSYVIVIVLVIVLFLVCWDLFNLLLLYLLHGISTGPQSLFPKSMCGTLAALHSCSLGICPELLPCIRHTLYVDTVAFHTVCRTHQAIMLLSRLFFFLLQLSLLLFTHVCNLMNNTSGKNCAHLWLQKHLQFLEYFDVIDV